MNRARHGALSLPVTAATPFPVQVASAVGAQGRGQAQRAGTAAQVRVCVLRVHALSGDARH